MIRSIRYTVMVSSCAILALFFSGCGNINSVLQNYLVVERERLQVEQEKIGNDRYFMSRGSGDLEVPFILDKRTGGVYKFYIQNDQMGFNAMPYIFGKSVGYTPDILWANVREQLNQANQQK